MDYPKIPDISLSINQNIVEKHCIELIKQADSLLSLMNKEKPQKSKEKDIPQLTPEFEKAVKHLTNRLKSYKKPETPILTRPSPTTIERIGPGSYNAIRSFTPVIIPNILLLENIGIKQNRSLANTPNFIEKNKLKKKNFSFAKNHNIRVMNYLESRVLEQKRLSSKGRFRFVEKLGNTRLKKAYSKISSLTFTTFIQMTVVTRLYSMLAYKKRLRNKTIYTLEWLVKVFRAIGKMLRKLKKIRKRIADKNIIGMFQPVSRYILKERKEKYKKLVKSLKMVRKANLIFIVCCKWKKYILTIQRTYKDYLSIKKARIEVILKFFDKNFGTLKPWTALKSEEKLELAQILMKRLSLEYSREKCKFATNMKPIIKNFSRNLHLLEKNANSDLLGRKVNFGNIKEPKLNLFRRKSEFFDYLKSFERSVKRRASKSVKKIWTVKKK